MADAAEPAGAEAATPPSELPARPRRRWLRRALILGVALSLILVVAVLTMPWWLSPARVKALIEAQVPAITGLELKIDKLDYHPLSGVRLDGVDLMPPPGFHERPLHIGAAVVSYRVLPLLWGEVQVEEFSLRDPVIVLETVGGRRNFDVLLQIMNDKLGPSKETEPGPLSPVAVALKRAFVGPLTIRVLGEGPQLELTELWMRARMRLGDELSAWLKLSAEPQPSQHNLRFSQSALKGADSLSLNFTAQEVLTATAAATLGVQLKRAELSMDNQLSGEGRVAGRALPPLQAALSGGMQAELTEGRLRMSSLSMSFGEGVALTSAAELSGLWRWLESAGALPGGEAQLPLEKIGARQAEPTLSLSADGHAELPALLPYAKAFAPGLLLSGRLGVDALSVKLSPEALSSGRPGALSGGLSVQDVSVHAGPIRLVDLNLSLRPEAEEGLGAKLQGGFTHFQQSGVEVRRASMSASASTGELSPTLPGASMLAAELKAARISAAGAVLHDAYLELGAEGQAVLSEERAGQPPIRLSARAGIARASLPPGEGPRAKISGLSMRFEASPERLVLPARRRIPIEASMGLKGYRAGDISARGLSLGLTAAVEDPRVEAPPCEVPLSCPRWRPPWAQPAGASQRDFDLSSTLVMRLASARAADARISRVSGRLALEAEDIGQHPSVAGAPPIAPKALRAELNASARSLGVAGPKGQRMSVPGRISGRLSAQLPQGRLQLSRLRMSLGGLLKARGAVRVRQAYSARPYTKGQLDGEAPDLERLIAQIPPFLKGNVPDLTGAGAVAMSARWSGRPPRAGADIDPMHPPINGRLSVQASGVGVDSALQDLSLSGLNGGLQAELRPGRLLFSPKLSWDALSLGLPADPAVEGGAERKLSLSKVSIDLEAGLSEDTWRLRGGAKAAELRTEVGGDELVDSAALTVDAGYPRGGEVYIRSLDMNLPATGLVASASGRLKRGRFGALSPELMMDGQVDLSRLAALLPAVPGQGKLSLALTVTPVSDRRVALSGRMRMLDFSLAQDEMALSGATGILPFSQSIWLPAPSPIPAKILLEGAVPTLQARLTQLQERLTAAKLIVSEDNILEDAPKTADHQALEPYLKGRRASLVADSLSYGEQRMSALRLEGAWFDGVLRLDRFQAKVWEGDMLADMALQITPDLDLRVRLRGTATDLNLDIPYAAAKKIAPVTEGKEDYLASATMDFEFGLRERVINGRMEVLKISLPLVQRMFGAMDPSQTSGAVQALDASERLGLRPVAATAWISQNLLNVQFEWEQLFFHIYYPSLNPLWLVVDTALIALRPVTALVGGAWIIQTVNGALNRVPFGSYLETVLAQTRPQAKLTAALSGRVISEAAVSEARPE